MMTEKDLLRYKYAVLEERRRRRLVVEHEARLNALKPCISATPPNYGGDGTGKIAADLDRLDRSRARLKEAIEEVSLAELVLESARKHLDEQERTVFDVLYFGCYNNVGERVFCTIREAASRLRYAPSSIYYYRRRILEKIAPLPA